MGSKGRPFYRIVVAKSAAGRDGAFIDIVGTSNPTASTNRTQINEEKALKWLLSGAQPTETVAYMLKAAGVLDKFFEQRPGAKAKYKSLDKRTAAISKASTVEKAKAEAKTEEVVAEAPVAVEAPAAEAPVAEAPVAEAPVTEAETAEAPAEA